MVALLQSSKGGFFFARDDWNPWSNRSSVGGVKQNRGLSNFRVKFHESSALEAKCYLKVIRCAPNVKIQFFAKETWTCSKHYISFSSVGYSSRIRDDFRGFSHASTFLRMLQIASRMQIASTCVHFRGSRWMGSPGSAPG